MGFFKKLRIIRENVHKIRDAALAMPDTWADKAVSEDWTEEFSKTWDLVKPLLELTKTVTPDKLDKIIDEIIILGGEVATAGAQSDKASVFIEKFAEIWKFVRVAPFIAMKFTNDKVDRILERIVAWGDMISEQQGGQTA